MGTMIQTYGLDEEDFRGERSATIRGPLKGCNDLLVLTQPERDRRGSTAPISRPAPTSSRPTRSTPTALRWRSSASRSTCVELNRAAAEMARRAADEFTRRDPDRPRFVAGSIGPTDKTASISPRVERPRLPRRHLRRDGRGLHRADRGPGRGGVDILFPETPSTR